MALNFFPFYNIAPFSSAQIYSKYFQRGPKYRFLKYFSVFQFSIFLKKNYYKILTNFLNILKKVKFRLSKNQSSFKVHLSMGYPCHPLKYNVTKLLIIYNVLPQKLTQLKKNSVAKKAREGKTSYQQTLKKIQRRDTAKGALGLEIKTFLGFMCYVCNIQGSKTSCAHTHPHLPLQTQPLYQHWELPFQQGCTFIYGNSW